MGEAMEHVLNGGDHSEGSDNSSLFGDSNESFSSSTSDLTDDASSGSPKATSPKRNQSELDVNGEVFQFSSLMADLPIRRGLSKHYQGKSQSFACIFEARCIEDLAKKESPYAKRIKSCKSLAGLDKQNFVPGPYNKTITKKPPRGNSCASLISRRNSNGLLCSGKPPVPVYRS
ncbi:oxidative stress 3 [Rhynchospora pubera]|uniref:Oxidative stress 3 n=1 Tax=Rhynchospora pubera TaxID=906938 RepID=A0AAV8DP11_9POAL|nr:oxidative stress 3 [Rhynchospora pubera]